MTSRDKKVGESKLAAQAVETRRKLIEAVLELLPKHSFHTLSLDTIAAHVGMTKGAIYGSFPSKYALITEALGTRPGLRPEHLNWPQGRDGSVQERMRKLGEAVLAGLKESSALAPASTELVLHALKDGEARQRRIAIGPEIRILIEEKLLGLFAPEELPMPPHTFALVFSLLVPGLLFARAYEGNAIDDETVLAIFDGFAAAADL
jgi:AcrR family transcriptional regulator